ncbi:retrovirus-related pol polyprotein from transposon TNT 1-94, partial [Tanacetum coccineum]
GIPSARSSSSKNSVLLNTKIHSEVVEVYAQKNKKTNVTSRMNVVKTKKQIVDSGCSNDMTGNLKLLRNFIEKFTGTVRFGNDHFAAIIGYGDYVHGNVTICHVYYVEGLRHNLFSVGQFCDGDLEVAFRSKTCYVRNLEGEDLLTDLVDGLPKFKYDKDHLCSACKQGKSKKASLQPKLVPSTHSKLELIHMDLCEPMRVESNNGKKYILVIFDDYSRYTWKVRSDIGTKFKNATLKSYYEKLGIMQQFSSARTPQQNGVVERRNHTLVEAAQTMLIFSKALEFLWAEAISIACFTQNHNKAPPLVSSSEEQTSPISNDVANEYIQADFADLDRNTLTTLYCPPVTEEAKSSSTNQDQSNMHEFNQDVDLSGVASCDDNANANLPPTNNCHVLPATLHARIDQELHELHVISALVDSRLECIEQFLNNFANQPNETIMNNLESDDEMGDTPLISPFPHSHNDLDDGEVLNKLIEYKNAGTLCRERIINSLDRMT